MGIQEYSRAIELKKKFPEAFFHRGLTQKIYGLQEDAISDFQKALKLKKNLYQAHFELGKIHLESKDFHKAMESLTRCLEENSKFKPALKKMLELCHEKKWTEKIRFYLESALKSYPRDLFFRRMNRIHKIVPENSLPKMNLKRKRRRKKISPPPKKVSRPKKEAIVLELSKNEPASEKPKVEIEFTPAPKKKKIKGSPFPDHIWY